MYARIVVIFFSLSLLNACATYVPIEKTIGETPYDVFVGDKVRVVTKDQQSYEFKVVEITGDSLKGKKVEIPFKNIDELLVKKSNDVADGWKIVGISFGISLVLVAGMLAILMSQGPISIGGG